MQGRQAKNYNPAVKGRMTRYGTLIITLIYIDPSHDALFGPNVAYAWQAANGAKIRLAGTALGGGTRPAELGVTLKKGGGLADAVQTALNGVIQTGEYQKVLVRWGAQAEAIQHSVINPPGLGD